MTTADLSPAPTLKIADLEIDTHARTVSRHGRLRPRLTRQEWSILMFLAAHPTRVFTVAELLDGVWGNALHVGGAERMAIHRLRSKLGNPYVQNIWGVGYRLVAPVQ